MSTKDMGIGIFIADLHCDAAYGEIIEFTFLWKESNSWENKNYSVEIYES